MNILKTTMAKDYFCDTCHEEKHLDEMALGQEAEICEECHEKWFQEQVAYWKPLYEAEKRAACSTHQWQRTTRQSTATPTTRRTSDETS